MDHEAFLIASYLAAGAICAGIGWSAWAWLRASIGAIANLVPPHPLKPIVARAFPSSAILFALSGFMSVDYYACGNRTYAQIVTDRSWMLECNQRQLAEALTHTAWMVCIWVVIVSIAVIGIRRKRSA